jgi:hypothetical protein
VAITADAWSAPHHHHHKRLYLSLSAHWLDSESRSRQSALLVCRRRLTGPLTADRLAKALAEATEKFWLHGKLLRITTDCGANLSRQTTFADFSAEPPSAAPEVSGTSADKSDRNGDQNVDDCDDEYDEEKVDENLLQSVQLEEILAAGKPQSSILPPHMR